MTYSIETKNISKSYNGKIILNNISLKLPSTGIFGVLGKNGAGKTTFLAMLMGLISPSSGEPADIISPTIGKLVISVLRVYAGIIVPVVKK